MLIKGKNKYFSINGVLLDRVHYQGLLLGSGLVLMVLSLISFVLYKEEQSLHEPGKNK